MAADGRVLVVSWPHEQEPPAVTPPPAEAPVWSDPVWDALASLRHGRAEPWAAGYLDVLGELELRRLVLADRDAFFRLMPEVTGRWGTLYGGGAVDVFRSDLLLGTGGPTVPVLRMLDQLIAARKPRLVVSVGLGGGVRPEDQVGDVVVATNAAFELGGDLRTYEGNGRTFGGGSPAQDDWFADIRLGELQELPLLPASPSFEQPAGGWPQPPAHRPGVRVEPERAVLTTPASDADAFVPAPTEEGQKPALGDRAAVDRDSAAAARACQEAQVPFAAVIGLSVPAIEVFEDDFEHNLRDAWASAYNRAFGPAAAANAAQVVARLVERQPA